MNINATILVQAFNFVIAYYLFREILLKPAYAILQEEHNAQAFLQEAIEQEKRRIAREKSIQKEEWVLFSEWCADTIPALRATAVYKGITPSITIPVWTKKEYQDAESKMIRMFTETFRERYE